MGQVARRLLRLAFAAWACLSLLLGLACHPRGSEGSLDQSPVPDAEIVARLDPDGVAPWSQGPPLAGPVAARLVDFGPQGDVDPEVHFYVRFDQAVTRPSAGTPPLIRVEPPVAGTLRWIDAYQAVFEPAAPLEPGHAYTVIAQGSVTTADGHAAKIDRRWTLEVDRPEVQIAIIGDNGYLNAPQDGEAPLAHWKSRALVTVDRPTTLDAVREHLKVWSWPANEPRARHHPAALPFRVREPSARELKRWGDQFYEQDALFVVEPTETWPLDSTVEFAIDAGLRAIDDQLGPRRDLAARMLTPLGLGVRHECAIKYSDGCDPGPVYLEFNRPILKRQLRNVRVSPRPARLKITAEDSWGGGIREVEINGKFKPGERYTITLAPETQDIHGQPLARPFRQSIDFVLPEPRIGLSGHNGFLLADQPTTIGIESRWIERARVRVAVLDDEATLALLAHSRLREAPFPREGATITEREHSLHPKGRFGWSSEAIDLADFIGKKRRAVLVEVTPLALSPGAARRAMPPSTRGLYQVTELGALALSSSANATARVSRLSTGAPLADAEVQLFHARGRQTPLAVGPLGRTDARGLAPLPAAADTPTGDALMLVRNPAEDDRFVAKLHDLRRLSEGPGPGYRRGETVLARVATERPIYRPGEKIRVVGWASVQTPHTASGLRPAPAGSKVEVALLDNDGDVIKRREVRLKKYGKFWATLRLPKRAALGRYRVEATVGDRTTRASLRVREFRTPAFVVNIASDKGDYQHGDTATITAGASYLFGAHVPITSARRFDSCRITEYRPPGLPFEWVVGRAPEVREPSSLRRRAALFPDPADASRLGYTIALDTLDTAWPYRCRASVGVQDAAAAEMGADTSFIVHPSRYLLLRSPPWRVEEGGAIAPRVRVVDHRGQRVAPTRVRVEVIRHFDVEDDQGRTVEKTRTVKACTLTTKTTGDDPRCPLSGLKHGDYEIKARPLDKGPRVEATDSFWVSRGGPRSGKPRPRLTLALSDPEPKPGDTLTITVRAPSKDARGLLTFMRGGLRMVEPFALKGGRYEHTVEVTDAWIPGMRIQAILVKPATPKARDLVERSSIHVRVGAESRRLKVEVRAPDTAGPRQALPIDITVRDADGEPLAGHVSLWAVDEAILALQEPRLPDLVRAFLVSRDPETSLHEDFRQRLRPYVVRADPYDFGYNTIGLGNIGTIGKGGGGGTGAGHSGRGSRTPGIREDLETTPIFLGDVAVDASGHARVEGTLPDNLTTFRITAVASAELPGGGSIGRFGHADTRVRVTAPLVVQAALPRHLRPGDTAEVAALVDNLGGPAGTVTVSLAVDGDDDAIRLRSGPTQVVHLEAGAQVRVPFAIEAQAPGAPALTLTAVLTADQDDVRLGDALKTVIPVEVEASLVRQVAVYGSLGEDDPAAVALLPPRGAQPGLGGLDVATSSTLLGGAEDMVEGLITYPYGCAEQTASRLLPLAALGTLAEHYPLGIDDLDGWVRAGVTRLRSMQLHGGGLAYWPGQLKAHPYATAYAAWVLHQLHRAGYPVSPRFMERLREYLAGEIEGWASHGTPTVDDDIRLAMALVAIGSRTPALDESLDGLHERREHLPLFGRALTLLALHEADPDDPRVAAVAEELLGGLDEREGFAHVRDSGRWQGAFFDSGPRTEAMVLLALLKAKPDDRRVETLTRGLMALRRDGALRNTQERAYALLALGEYARRFEAEVPAFDTRVWLDADLVGRGRFEGRGADVQAHTVPLPWSTLAGEAKPSDPGDHRITLQREGRGRMYYRVGMRWVPDATDITPHAAGLFVERTLRTEAGPLDAGRHIAHGELVALDLTLSTNDAMTYVAIDIPLPAGLESVDPTIGHGRRAMVLPGVKGHWVSHRELRTERALLFADRLSPGEHRHTVYLRATTPGRFIMPPTRAEAMYYPEVQGNTGSEIVEVR